ncbi:beta-lactamase-like protein [Pseudomassariella vexata]|uniref:Beta-lactamase-like protein n=1 Tax=Pseudomassariella vexata TaxID=1141098 RepID=A0A1Y2EIT6_9PEZI|nr:beta-lactamase-like protein [Pseudomassariella vexata]ORY71357.1 beta-lactamase-like protein [Pseudomassariella vexata]
MASPTAKPQGFYSSGFWVDYLSTQRSKLPALPDVDEDISGCVVRFLGGNPGNMQLQGTNTYLVGTGSTRILIDTGEGFPQWAKRVTRYLEDHDLSISHVLLTHWHGDHTGGVADLVAYDARTTVHKHTPDPFQHAIADGQVFRTEGATLRAVLTPGHTTDHACFVLEEESALFTGDNVLGHGYSVAEDLGAYTASLRLMARLECRVGYPGHGVVIRDLPRKLAMYIAQREARERQIYAAVLQNSSSSSSSRSNSSGEGEGLSTTDISRVLYGAVSEDNAAFESALKPLLNQVLFMLAEHGKVGSKLVGLDKTRHWFARAQSM